MQERVLPLTKKQAIARRAAELLKVPSRWIPSQDSLEVLNLVTSDSFIGALDETHAYIQNIDGTPSQICATITQVTEEDGSKIGRVLGKDHKPTDTYVFNVTGCIWRIVA